MFIQVRDNTTDLTTTYEVVEVIEKPFYYVVKCGKPNDTRVFSKFRFAVYRLSE